MVAVSGLIGFRPHPELVCRVTCPPYDVIKRGSLLWHRLAAEPLSVFHVILGERPVEALEKLIKEGALVSDEEPAFYVYEQRYLAPTGHEEVRIGVLLAAEVTPYETGHFIRHEKTFDEKVKGRIALAQAIGHTAGAVFTICPHPLRHLLEPLTRSAPLYEFTSDFGGESDLHGVHSRVFRIPADSKEGREIVDALAPHSLYIADGHHRYHAALLGGQANTLVYVTDFARIQA
ncbi:MAG: DUF1015 family protein [Sandaracinaceae bacterium]|nr:DUF1015 family protein [Sandaracinaceae bacterium]